MYGKIYRVIEEDSFSSLEVNYDTSLEDLLSKSGIRTLSEFDQNIKSLNPEQKKKGLHKIRVALVMFDTKPAMMVTTYEINSWAQRNGYRQADIKELVCFFMRFRLPTGNSLREATMALGSSIGKREAFYEFFPCYQLSELSTDMGLMNFMGCRQFSLNGWDYHHKFLMVKD